MKKIIILIPVYNDWESLTKLLKEIDEVLKDINNFEFKLYRNKRFFNR